MPALLIACDSLPARNSSLPCNPYFHKKAPIKGALFMGQTNQERVVKLEFERGFYKSTKFVLAAGLSFAVGVVNPEDRRSNGDVVADCKVVVTLNGEVGFVTG